MPEMRMMDLLIPMLAARENVAKHSFWAFEAITNSARAMCKATPDAESCMGICTWHTC